MVSRLTCLLCALLLAACSGAASHQKSTPKPPPGPSLQQRQANASACMAQLKAGKFDEAQQAAAALIARDKGNPYANAVAGVTHYKKTMHQFSTDVRTVVFGAMAAGGFNHKYMRNTLSETEVALGEVEAYLAMAARSPSVSLELCLACWEIDWNRNGQVDRRDRRLFAIEHDAKGNRIPEDDPRFRPVFRFDHGDLAWARAFIAFQRAALDLVLAYKWTELDRLLGRMRSRGEEPKRLHFKLEHPARVAAARAQILAGLKHADDSRVAYLAETDDDREWLPNPTQKDHPMPLPVDAALYKTWEGVIADLQDMLAGKTGLSVAQLAQLGDHKWEHPPTGFLDIGRMLSKPKDIVLNLKALGDLDKRGEDKDKVEAALKEHLGEYYRKKMKQTPLIKRLERMKSEIKRGEESMERKLRYLLWLN